MTDAVTRAWVRNASDEKAILAGCAFRPAWGAEVVWWIERYCRLYEGQQAGEPLILRGCHACGTYGLPAAADFDDWGEEAKAVGLERAARYAECYHAGHAVDWQYECTMRLFSWARFSKRWGEWI